MKTYNIQIRVDRGYFGMEMDADTPALLVDEIRKLAKEYFDDVINPKVDMFFSCVERHVDGSFWYHGDTFPTREQAETFMAGWIPWDPDREKRIIEHEKPLPNETCCTFDFHTFGFGGITLCTI